jgi:hypothetical protein
MPLEANHICVLEIIINFLNHNKNENKKTYKIYDEIQLIQEMQQLLDIQYHYHLYHYYVCFRNGFTKQ